MRKLSLLKGIKDKIITWTYTDTNIKENEIMEKLVFDQTDLTVCFCITKEDTFLKIKTGLLEERSPPPRKAKEEKCIEQGNKKKTEIKPRKTTQRKKGRKRKLPKTWIIYIIIAQHNVLHWSRRKFSYTQIYKQKNHHVILLNSHGLKTNDQLNIQGYTTYKINSSQEINDGSTILIKNNISHRLDDNYITDMLEFIIQTEVGKDGLATTYLPLRRPYLPFPDVNKIASKQTPTYLIGDISSALRTQGYASSSQVGRSLERLVRNGSFTVLGPQFPTYLDRRSSTAPDIVLGNKNTIHNITIYPGPLTESDHIPLVITLTTKAVTNIIPPRPNLTKAKWTLFANVVVEEIRNVDLMEHLATTDIDNVIEK